MAGDLWGFVWNRILMESRRRDLTLKIVGDLWAFVWNRILIVHNRGRKINGFPENFRKRVLPQSYVLLSKRRFLDMGRLFFVKQTLE